MKKKKSNFIFYIIKYKKYIKIYKKIVVIKIHTYIYYKLLLINKHVKLYFNFSSSLN